MHKVSIHAALLLFIPIFLKLNLHLDLVILIHVQCKYVFSKLHGETNKDGRQISGLFLEVPKRNEMPDYYKVVAQPITVHEIEEKLDYLEYPNVIEFASDVHLLIDNGAHYHSASAEVIVPINCHECFLKS
jgi:hypothetical protein